MMTEAELREWVEPYTKRLPPAVDDPAYMARYRRLCDGGMHPAVAAVQAADHHPPRHRQVAA